MTFGAPTSVAPPAAASTPPAFTMNRRRSMVVILLHPEGRLDPLEAWLPRHELMIGAFGDVVPRAEQCLELRERRVDLPGRGRLFRLLPKDVGRQLPQIAEDRRRELEHLDLVLELGLEPVESDRVLRVMLREAVHLDGRGGVVEHSSQVDGKRLVRFLVETEIQRGA